MPKPLPREHWEALRAYAVTPTQQVVIEALIECGTVNAAAEHMGRDIRSVYRTIGRVRRLASRAESGEDSLDIEKLHDTSRLERGGPGDDFALRWVKKKASTQQIRDAIQIAVETLSEHIDPKKPTPPPQEKAPEDLLNMFLLTDYHLGMMAWPEETRDDLWDIRVAEQMIYDWIDYSVLKAPQAPVGLFAQLGDFFHWDGLNALTNRSKHPLDAATRYQHMVRIGVKATQHVIDTMLRKHDKVILLMAEGNHDEHSSIVMRETFSHFLQNEPRVHVITDPDPYYCVQHGNTSLFFHHGHMTKFEQLDKVFTQKFRDIYGQTKYSYAHSGHYHHQRVLETNLMLLEQHPTLSASSSHDSRSGYASMRSTPVITYHKEYGEVGRFSCKPQML